jgi:catechol 2,3-dioxygenase-like lactoylglutathione lyase family enzyme
MLAAVPLNKGVPAVTCQSGDFPAARGRAFRSRGAGNEDEKRAERALAADIDREGPDIVDMDLEVVVLPVADVDRAKDFYKQTMGWREDADIARGQDFREVQMTPPGSACSVIFGTGVTTAEPGSLQGLHLVVNDIAAARAELNGRGAEVSEVFHDAGGVFHHAGTKDRVAGPAPKDTYGSFASFSDPDGNGWFLQEITKRIPGR